MEAVKQPVKANNTRRPQLDVRIFLAALATGLLGKEGAKLAGLFERRVAGSLSMTSFPPSAPPWQRPNYVGEEIRRLGCKWACL